MSRALPSFYYGDPAVVYEWMEVTRMGCRACVHRRTAFGRIVCGHVRNTKQCGVPLIGFRCKWFNDKERRDE